jgi:hypothetical protein
VSPEDLDEKSTKNRKKEKEDDEKMHIRMNGKCERTHSKE